MTGPVIGVVATLVLLAAAIPYVARIRHPQQRPLAAYLVFVSVFTAAAVVLLGLLVALADAVGLGARLEQTLPAILLLLLVVFPALFVARWQARRPPWRRAPPP